MAQTISEQLDQVLNDFERNVPHVEATAVVSTDGLVIASRLPDRGEMLRVLIEGTNGYLLIRSIGEVAILVVLVDKKVRLGMLFYECKQCINKLTEIL